MSETATVEASPARVDGAGGAESSAAAVRLRCVSVRFPGPVAALAEIDLEVRAGEHLVVLGSSGSGKTTLLGCLSGRLRPSSGETAGCGRAATIHQDLRLVKQESALTNVLHGALGRLGLWRTAVRFPGAERRRAAALLRRVGLGDRVHARVARLSGGEQQRVAIARALMQDPEVLLADEPVASLDQGNAHAVMGLLRELQRERGLTLVSVLHDCALAEGYADRIVGLEGGRIIHDQPAGAGRARRSDVAALAVLGQPHSCQGGAEPCKVCPERSGDAPVAAGAAIDELGVPPDPGARVRPIWYSLAAVAAVLVYAWAFRGLGITARDTEGFFGNIAEFAGRLVPTSAQLAKIKWGQLLESLLATLQMALLGTTLAVVVSWPLAACAARNVGPRWLRPICRLVLNVIRSVPSIIWALLFVGAVGLGPLAGVMALVIYSLGYLTKFFYEAFEAVDPGPPGALAEIGAGGLQRFLHAVWPASRAAVLSSAVFMLEYNVRAASVLGIVGAGGIGYELNNHKDFGNWHVVGAILLMLAAVVLVLDAVSGRIRGWLMRP